MNYYLKRKTTTNEDDNNTEKSKKKSWIKSFPGLGFVREGGSMWGHHMLQCVKRTEKLHCHTPNKDKSQWDRNWVRVLFIHGQPSIKELFPERLAQKHTDGEKQTHPGRQGDKYMNPSILQSALHSHSNSVASRDFENKICSFYHLKYIYLSS